VIATRPRADRTASLGCDRATPPPGGDTNGELRAGDFDRFIP
jgi:hypothetical protein